MFRYYSLSGLLVRKLSNAANAPSLHGTRPDWSPWHRLEASFTELMEAGQWPLSMFCRKSLMKKHKPPRRVGGRSVRSLMLGLKHVIMRKN